MTINLENLTKFLHDPALAERYLPHLLKYLPEFGIDTPEEQLAFLAQTHHESWGYTHLRENMHYSTKEQLVKVFPKYFRDMSDKRLKEFIGQDKKIGDLVYANRLGNGNEFSGDGYNFRGGGLIQITGRNWYTLLSKRTFKDDRLVVNPNLITDPEYAVASACFFWQECNLNHYAGDFEALTKRINGGLNNYAERVALLKRAQAIFL
jgi:putative chitinase